MALAAFGEDTYVERFRDVIRPTPDGGYAVNMAYFSYDAFGQLRPFKRKFIDTFGPPRLPGEPLTDRHHDVAFALQAVTEEIVLHRGARAAEEASRLRDLCMTGGVALNCVANAKILEQTDVRRLWVPPCASDTGCAARQRAVALPPRRWVMPARLRDEARRSTARPTATARSCDALDDAGLRYRRMPETQLLAARGAGPGRWQDRRLVPGPLRDGAARARQPLDPGRSAPGRHARCPQRQGQEARSRSARSRRRCWWSGAPSSSRSTSPTRS